MHSRHQPKISSQQRKFLFSQVSQPVHYRSLNFLGDQISEKLTVQQISLVERPRVLEPETLGQVAGHSVELLLEDVGEVLDDPL